VKTPKKTPSPESGEKTIKGGKKGSPDMVGKKKKNLSDFDPLLETLSVGKFKGVCC